MLDVATLSAQAHRAFEVAITVSRSGEDDRDVSAVLHLGSDEWHTHGGVTRRVSIDSLSVRQTVDIAPGDTITCADLTAVQESTTWTVADRMIGDGDVWIHTWRITNQGDAES